MGMTKELLNRSSMGKVKKASAIMENDGIATNWVLVHSNEGVLGFLDIYNLKILSLHLTYGCEATGGNN